MPWVLRRAFRQAEGSPATNNDQIIRHQWPPMFSDRLTFDWPVLQHKVQHVCDPTVTANPRAKCSITAVNDNVTAFRSHMSTTRLPAPNGDSSPGMYFDWFASPTTSTACSA